MDVLYAAISLINLSLLKKSAKVVPEPLELQCMNVQAGINRSGSQHGQSRLPGNPSVPQLGGLSTSSQGQPPIQQPPTPHNDPGRNQVRLEPVQGEKKTLSKELKGLSLQEAEDIDFMVPLSPPRLIRSSGVYPTTPTANRRMKTKLAKITTPAVSLVMDSLQGRVSTAQGTAQWFSGGNLTSQNSVNTGLTSSPECLTGLGGTLALNNDGTEGNTFGRGRSTFHSWEVKYRWMNQSNCPVELELYTLRCVKPLSVLAPGGITMATNLRSRMSQWYISQVGVAQPLFVLACCSGMFVVFCRLRNC